MPRKVAVRGLNLRARVEMQLRRVIEDQGTRAHVHRECARVCVCSPPTALVARLTQLCTRARAQARGGTNATTTATAAAAMPLTEFSNSFWVNLSRS